MTVHICDAGVAGLRREILRCPTEQRKTEMVISYPKSAYYAPTVMCCGCGDQWSEGERMMRPLARHWRRDAVLKHRRLWDQATHGPPPKLERTPN